ncbi:MAG: glycoside hydrolase family 97 protein [Bacteroidetes bacterium]|nr:glycoside hydrolase family 97 protein [Bacteroidota bacterium]
MKKVIFFALLSANFCFGQITEISSPGNRIKIRTAIKKGLQYAVYFDGKLIVSPSDIDLTLQRQKNLLSTASLKKTSTRKIRETILPAVAEKRKLIPDNYNELTLLFKESVAVIFRAYDDGIAYRFQTLFKDSITIENETAIFNFPENHFLYYPEVAKRQDADIFHTSFEEPYQLKPLDSIGEKNTLFNPVLIYPKQSPRLLITESDIEDYPGMFLTGNNTKLLKGKFAPYPLKEKMTEGGYQQYLVTERANYIAKTKGTRNFPWRIIAIAEQDKDLPGNDIVYRLASPSRIGDASWVHPGKGTDEWIIGTNVFNVPFRSGVNTDLYKYYIDFAKRFGFDRIMMDAGWSDTRNLFKIDPNINMDEITSYAKEKGIKISMWTLALTLDAQLEPALQQFQKWGVDFIMTDFMDRDDQKMVNFYYRVAQACAKYKIMIMYHGAYKPAGFGRTFPNAITRESVLGSEYNIWSNKPTPDHNLMLPFIRMVAGPMDYEPGILDNATKKTFRPIEEKVMSSGTRCHQLAMFVVYESPIQIFSGNPSQGYMEPSFMELLGSIPTVWDETKIIDGKVGEYIITARKKGDDWYIGSMSNWNARELKLPLDFLDNGAEYNAVICEDGINADRYASDYKMSETKYTSKDIVTIKLAPGGGFMLRLRKR